MLVVMVGCVDAATDGESATSEENSEETGGDSEVDLLEYRYLTRLADIAYREAVEKKAVYDALVTRIEVLEKRLFSDEEVLSTLLGPKESVETYASGLSIHSGSYLGVEAVELISSRIALPPGHSD